MHIYAPAKINLGLEVLRRRPDGFHDINTIYAAVDFCDEIELELRHDRQILCVVEGNQSLKEEPAEENLCVRAARAVQDAAGKMTTGVNILLRKKIPTGAGLGGGSSDAAATLIGCTELWHPDLSDEELTATASRLGSDIPFFLGKSPAHALSRGETLVPLDLLLPWAVLLVNPGIHIPTPWAYRAVNRTEPRSPSDLVAALHTGLTDPFSMREHITNDFEAPVFAEHPLLEELKNRLYEAGACFALMSGSGSTLFGLFQEREQAKIAGNEFGEYWHRVAGFRGGNILHYSR